jgi:hypothetical protein
MSLEDVIAAAPNVAAALMKHLIARVTAGVASSMKQLK